MAMAMDRSATARARDAPLLEVHGVTLQYKTREHLVTATYRVDFDVFRGDRFVLLGPSGCGKSSLLKGVGGFLRPVEGRIRLNGRVMQNVMFPLRTSGKCGRREAMARALAAIVKVGLEKFRDVYPHMLSGGMKQRVAIARAMAMEPEILLMDEPFAALDALTRRKMQEELLQLWDELRFTVLFVTHSIEEAVIVGNRILVLSPHPGQVKAELNSTSPGGAEAAALQRRIHDMLFAERVEATEASP
jgi:NitT/TauT family transport system ATP-binding protein